VRAAPAPSPGRVTFLADHIDFAIKMLHVHHKGEDELLYPKPIERVPEQAPMTEEVEHEHQLIATALDDASAACAAWRQRPSAETGEALAAALDRLNAVAQRHLDDEEQKIVPLAAVTLTQQRLLSRRDIPLREKALWRMLYETAARASEILALNVEDLDLEQRRAPVRSKGGDTEFIYWDTGTAHLLPRLLRLPDGTSRISGPLFLASRRPVPARRPAPRDICPHTGRARLGYDRARVLFKKYTATATSNGLELHQLRHSAATHLGDQKVPLQLIMAKTRHKSPRTAMRYVKPGDEAVAEVTSLLGPPRRSH